MVHDNKQGQTGRGSGRWGVNIIFVLLFTNKMKKLLANRIANTSAKTTKRTR